uniref:Uncharacterized protein n=1 Tax=Triticum aestivum TaxID=4565 RepID=A0A077S0Q4_WHEAT|nr:unnamed protein product [Triticum aestivum]
MTTRRWWKRRDGSDDADDLVPMDTQGMYHREELVRSLEQKQVHQSRRWRHVFAGFLLSYTVFLVYSSFHHAWSPWELVPASPGASVNTQIVYHTIYYTCSRIRVSGGDYKHWYMNGKGDREGRGTESRRRRVP